MRVCEAACEVGGGRICRCKTDFLTGLGAGYNAASSVAQGRKGISMFAWLNKMLGKKNEPEVEESRSPSATPKSQFEQLNKIAPLQGTGETRRVDSSASPGNEGGGTSFIRREPVLNRGEQIAGYAFFLNEKLQLRLQGEKDLLQKVYDDALLRNLTSLGVNTLLGHRLAFVRISPSSLDNPLLAALPAENTVIILSPTRQPLAFYDIQGRLDELRKRGYVYGWLLRKPQVEQHPELLQLAALGDYLQIEISSFDGMDIKPLLRELLTHRPAGLPPLRLIGHELDSHDEFHLCFKGGFDLFAGRFITSRENWHPPKTEINRLLVIVLLNLLRGDEELKVIADRLTMDPVMTYKLLRYLNSPVMGLQQPVSSMDKALIVLGREKFYRWLSLLLFDIKSPGFRERLLTEQALSRAALLESLAGHGKIPKEKDALFILGLFSMLDLLMGQPIEIILQQTKLAPALHDALLGKPGVLHDALQLVIATEEAPEEVMKERAAACGLDSVEVTQSLLAALKWASEMSSITES